MNTSSFSASFHCTLALALLSLSAPTKLKAENVHTAHPGIIKSSFNRLTTAVPEPSSFVLLGSGLVLAALALRNKGVGV